MHKLSIALLIATLALIAPGHATTFDVACTGTISSAVQSAINGSRDGDVIRIGAGNCSMSGLNFNGKSVQINGAGSDRTTITANERIFYGEWPGNEGAKFRISGIKFTGTGDPNTLMEFWATSTPAKFRGPFRIDHNIFDYPNQGSGGAFGLYGTIYGLWDHNTFKFRSSNGYSILAISGPTVEGEYCGSAFAWQGGPCNYNTLSGGAHAGLPFDKGGPQNVFYEDNVWEAPSGGNIWPLDTAYNGSRVVFRNNTLTNAILYQHWTSKGSVNAGWWEVYHNTFNWVGPDQGMYPARWQGGGTGLWYENTIKGYNNNYILLGEGRNPSQNQSGSPMNLCDGRQPVDGNAGDPAAPGWPCISQTGRDAGVSIADIVAGKAKQASYPLYVWRNGPEDACRQATGTCSNSFGVSVYGGQNAWFKSTPHPNGDVDWSKTATKPTGAGTHQLSYTPFPYPYPLTAEGMPDPSGSGGTVPPEPIPPEPIPPTGDATSMFLPTDIPRNPSEADSNSVELGMKFSASKAGQITGVRFYKGAGNTGNHSGSLWSSTGMRLANVSFTGETDTGWQEMQFAQPVAITANTQYVISYHSGGRYASDQNYFAQAKTNAPLSTPVNAGVFKYSTSPVFPTETWNATNYWVDVVYAPTGDGPPPVTAAPVIMLSARATRGQAFTYTVVASNTPGSFTATGLPPGLAINGTTGVISGTPTATGTSDIAITATNSKGSDTEVLRLTVQ